MAKGFRAVVVMQAVDVIYDAECAPVYAHPVVEDKGGKFAPPMQKDDTPSGFVRDGSYWTPGFALEF